MQKSIEEDSKSKEEKTSIIAKAAIQYVFPKKYNTIDEKLYDINLPDAMQLLSSCVLR